MSEIHLTPQQLRTAQLTQLKMLREVDRVCRENDVKYSLAGGTLLGAVRHKGYIPWDDDADIVMLRPEYEKFRLLFDKKCDHTKFYFQDARNTEGYRWGYGKIRRKGTLWVRSGQEHMPYGQEIFIDIFPIDAVANGFLSGWLHNFHCYLLRKIFWSEVGKFTEAYAFKRIVFLLLSLIPFKKVHRHYLKFAKKHNIPQNHRLRVLTFPTPKGFVYEGKRDWYANYTELEFEGFNFKVMCGYKDYLTLKYGDYMKLPPESERKTHPLSKFKELENL